ncbi:TetR family transcriptional regulator [Lottiidibacillus patelloidae]|uniref:TetR family transcriptional regulator n=1 Tax=Lottiidibacillus patelloidae TaxID=2670334 RepID=A0A263BT53_9BACI|nr:TetR/AcrR family transcriptional regulator [Lottiidibacillus patelloidae]OZM56752.1 TetR family transcriptional regulator [Lottiidibacillus patelloidae]
MNKREVPSLVKDEKLVKKRRDQMIKGAVKLFKEKGFHRTTTREIAKEAGFSIGTLYEYIRKKEDILYLVCDAIYDEVHEKLEKAIDRDKVTLESLEDALVAYFHVMDEMQDEVMVMYQESKSLSKEALPYVLKKEEEMVEIFIEMLSQLVQEKQLDLDEKEIQLISHQIVVQGQMWSFRRWGLKHLYTLEEFIEKQNRLIFKGILPEQ